MNKGSVTMGTVTMGTVTMETREKKGFMSVNTR